MLKCFYCFDMVITKNTLTFQGILLKWKLIINLSLFLFSLLKRSWCFKETIMYWPIKLLAWNKNNQRKIHGKKLKKPPLALLSLFLTDFWMSFFWSYIMTNYFRDTVSDIDEKVFQHPFRVSWLVERMLKSTFKYLGIITFIKLSHI